MTTEHQAKVWNQAAPVKPSEPYKVTDKMFICSLCHVPGGTLKKISDNVYRHIPGCQRQRFSNTQLKRIIKLQKQKKKG